MAITGNETLTNATESLINASSIGSLTNSFIQNISSIDLKIWYGAALLILIIIVFVYIYKKGSSPERYYKKAESLHEEALEFHQDGDDETANELYERAEEYRAKARELSYGVKEEKKNEWRRKLMV